MSSKRKSPPTKLQEGTNAPESLTPTHQTAPGSGSEGGGLTDLDETSSNNLSDICEEDTNTMVHNSNTFYKLSESSSPCSGSGSEVDDLDDDRIPNKTARMSCSSDSNILMSTNIQSLSLHNEQSRRRRNSSECSSPSSDIKTNIHYNNNNNISLHNNNSSSHPLKRSMDDVLKRLTSKINSSTIREEKRPTPSSTPTSTNNS